MNRSFVAYDLETAPPAARRLLEEGTGIVKAAKLAGLGVGTVHRIKAQLAQ